MNQYRKAQVMEKLTLKELMPYLLYRVKFISNLDLPFDEYKNNPIWTFDGRVDKLYGYYCLVTEERGDAYPISSIKPILRPLSDLTKEIEVNEEKFISRNRLSPFTNLLIDSKETNFLLASYLDMQKLFEWHFDVFGLIEKGLAIDINTLNL